MTTPFWQTKTLDEMTPEEWESLCDGCGRCCLHKLRDENRFAQVPDCIQLTPAMLREVDWLPPSCAYRRIAEGRGLPPWHPLRSGTTRTVVTSGASAGGRCISERDAGMLEDHVTDWPGRNPRAPRLR